MFRLPLLLLVPSLFLFLSCEKNRYTLKGTISCDYYDGDTVFLRQYSNDTLLNVASAVIKDGGFEFEGEASDPYVGGLYVSEVLIMPLVVEKGVIDVVLSDEDATVKGTSLNDAMLEYLDRMDGYKKEVADVSRMKARLIMDGVDADEADRVVEQAFVRLNVEMEVYINNFIKNHYNDIVGPFVFRQWYGHMLYPMSSSKAKELIENAPDFFRQHEYVKKVVQDGE